nr:immunoglobulin heavy chain junction region [Macaca mulatta]
CARFNYNSLYVW